MQFIDKQDNAAFAFLDFIQNGFQSFLEFTAVLGTCDQGTQIQRKDFPVFQICRHIAANDSQCQTLGNCRFTDTRFTDQHRIVFRLSGKDSNDVSNLVISANDRIQFSGTGTFYQILPVFCQHIVSFFRILIGNTLVAANFHQCRKECILSHGERFQHVLQFFAHGIEQAQYQMFYRYEIIFHAGSFFFCLPQCTVYVLRYIDLVCLPTASGYCRQIINGVFQLNLYVIDRHAHFLKQLRNQTALLLQQSTQQVYLFDLLVLVLHCKTICSLNRFQRLLCQFLCVHENSLLFLAFCFCCSFLSYGNTAQSLCVRCVVRFFGRLLRAI